MPNEMKEVYYDKFCKNCKYEKVQEQKDPCFECLSEPINFHSHQPINFENKSTKNIKRGKYYDKSNMRQMQKRYKSK